MSEDPIEIVYSPLTDPEVVRVLESCRNAARHLRPRIRIHYGDVETGQDWGDMYDVAGYVGRSAGRLPIPLLINNINSMGGGGIMTQHIVRIRYANRRQGGDLYRHPQYTPPVREDGYGNDYDKHFS